MGKDESLRWRPHRTTGRGAGTSSGEHIDGNQGWRRKQGLGHHGDDSSTGENKRPSSVAVRLGVKLNAVAENRVHDRIKGHECAL